MCIYFTQVKCDRCNGWVHQICDNLNPKDVMGSIRYMCPECTSNPDYAQFGFIDVHIAKAYNITIYNN